MDLLRKTDPSERNKDGALVAIPKKDKCGKNHNINNTNINIREREPSLFFPIDFYVWHIKEKTTLVQKNKESENF